MEIKYILREFLSKMV